MKYIKLYEDFNNSKDNYLKELDDEYDNIKHEIPESFKKDVIEKYKKTLLLDLKDGLLDNVPDFSSDDFKKRSERLILIKWKDKIKDIHDKKSEEETTQKQNIKDIENDIKYALTPYNNFKRPTNLSEEQTSYINDYKNFGYEDYNDNLRKGKINKSIIVLDSCFIHETEKDVIVGRMVQDDEYFKDKFTELAYMSTTCDLDYFKTVKKENSDEFKNAVIMKIIIPKGVKYLVPSRRNDIEKEVIFERGLTLEFVEMHRNYYVYKVVK